MFYFHLFCIAIFYEWGLHATQQLFDMSRRTSMREHEGRRFDCLWRTRKVHIPMMVLVFRRDSFLAAATYYVLNGWACS